MKASSDITRIELAEEFRVCPQCGYELGFHSSFLQSGRRLQDNSHLPGMRGEVRCGMEGVREPL